MDLKLNIYDKKEITKTYTAETYDLMFGTVEDLLDVIDIDNIQASNKAELLKAIAKVLECGKRTARFIRAKTEGIDSFPGFYAETFSEKRKNVCW